MDELKTISLKGGEYYITQREADAFLVRSGRLLVYIVPMRGDEPGRRSLLYEAGEGEVVPGFVYRDMEYRDWRFCFVALGSCVLAVIENGSTKMLRERFARRAGLDGCEAEGYREALVDRYRVNAVREDGFIMRTQRDREADSARAQQLVLDALRKDKTHARTEKTGDPLFDSVSLLCARRHIPMVPMVKLREACGGNVTLEDIARLSRFAFREVILEPGWQDRDFGDLLVFNREGKPFPCLSKGGRSYVLRNVENGTSLPVSEKNFRDISPRAFILCRSLPARRLEQRDVAGFCAGSIYKADTVRLAVLTLVIAFVGLLIPALIRGVYDVCIPLGEKAVLFQLGCVMAACVLASGMFSIVKNRAVFRIAGKMSCDMQNAVYCRLFDMPESFFRRFDSADLARRAMGAGSLVYSAASAVLTMASAAVPLIIYWVCMFVCSTYLALAGTALVFLYAALYFLVYAPEVKYRQRSANMEGEADTLMYNLLYGIEKIRTAGVEDRALYEYLRSCCKLLNSREKQDAIPEHGAVVSLAASGVFTAVLYVVAVRAEQQISAGTFMAFCSLFGVFTACVMGAVRGAVGIRGLRPLWELLRPILEEAPESDDGKELPGNITGAIKLDGVSFAYSGDEAKVLENISLTIRRGEYVGIVGPSGCGKSTLLKLLLGFERPCEGKIYYDGRDLESLDKRELRRKLGVVLQDGKLISGSIYENITVTAPRAGLREVQAAVRAVGLESDIAGMPMGLYTVLSEDGGTISGGQRQRILIARAILPNPKILFFDEATSALDNESQKLICDSLDRMDCTRVIIAHRLSTVQGCDRILVMSKGKIVEEGTYEELLAAGGMFAGLAGRQM